MSDVLRRLLAGLTWMRKPGFWDYWLLLCKMFWWAESPGMVSFFSYGLHETLSMAFIYVTKQCQNLEFSSASVIFKVTFEYDNQVSGNDEHRCIRLFDKFNHVVGSIFGGGCWKHQLHMTNETSWNLLKSRKNLTGIVRICTTRNRNVFLI